MRITGINQIAWEPAANTLHVESDQLLRQHTTYVLVVTTDVRDATGKKIKSAWFHNSHLVHGLPGKLLSKVAVASIFTTQSATAVLEQVRRQIKASSPSPASFVLGAGGERTVFPTTDVTSILFSRQTTTAPGFAVSPTGTPFLAGVGSIAFGAFDSPDYQTPSKVIPPVGSRTGVPAVQGTNRLYFNLFLPAGTAPAGGWPVAIYGHGFTDNKNASPFVVAGSMARRGIATIAINVVGHGGGPLGTLIVNRAAGGPVVLPAGGREVDVDGNGVFGGTDGINATPPQTLIGSRDGLRQTVIDLMQLVREVEVGMDVDGNGTRDLDPAKISYFGQSFGGIYGTKFLAVEPNVRLGVPNVPGGAIVEIARLSPSFRGLVTLSLINRTPPLIEPARDSPSTRTCRCGTCRRWSTRSRGRRRSNSCSSGPSGALNLATRLRTLSTCAHNRCRACRRSRSSCSTRAPTRPCRTRRPRRSSAPAGCEDRTTLFRNDLAFAAESDVPEEPAHVPDQAARSRRRPAPAWWRSRPRIRSRSSSLPAVRSSSIPTAPGRSSKPRWRGHRRRTWRTSRDLVRELLELLEAGPGDNLLPGLAWLAGQEVELDPDEVKATVRRAELLLAAGGDPRRELELDGRAVTSVAEDLDEPSARDQLEDSLARLAAASEGLPAVSDGLARLRAQPDLAWQSYACALLAEAMGTD